jgi:Protein of unknown function (DUF3551)
MRPPMLSLVVLAAALLGEFQAASAQSPTSYPWCSKGTKGGAISCYYTSYEQCRTTQSGIGGICIQSPYYRRAPTDPTLDPRRYRAR